MRNPFRRSRIASPAEMRQAFQAMVDYWEGRIALGDPLFDQWMVDEYEAVKDGIRVMDRLEACGLDTRKAR